MPHNNGHALAMAGNSMLVSPYRQPNKEIKVQNMNKSPPMIFQQERKPVNEQKVRILILQPCYLPMRMLCVSCHSSTLIIVVCQPLTKPVTAANCQTNLTNSRSGNNIMSEQNELKVFTAEQDNEKIEEIVSQVMPILKGATVSQIKMALDKAYALVKLCYVVS